MEVGGRGVWIDGICFSKTPLSVMGPGFPGDSWTYLPMESGELIPCSALPVHVAFVLPMELYLTRVLIFLPF